MSDPLETYEEHIDHCFSLAEKAPDDLMRARFLYLARLFEIEHRLIHRARSNLSESRKLLERAGAILAKTPTAAVETPLPVQPFRGTDGQGLRT